MSEDFGGSGGSWGEDGGGGSFSETSSQSWFQRLGNAILGVLIGLVLMVVSVALLFWNEGRAVDRARGLEEAGGAVVSVSSDKVDPANEAKLVHTTGNLAVDETLSDDQFGVQAKGMIQLSRKVEMYQWKENVKEETQKQVGGSTKTKKTYSYERIWSDHPIDSNAFKDPGNNNPPWPGNLSSTKFTATKVMLGAFMLSPNLIGKIDGPEALNLTEADAQKLPDTMKSDCRVEAGAFFKGKGDPANPSIGDIKVTYTVTKPRQVGVIAEQSQNSFRAYQPKSATSTIEELQNGNPSAKDMIRRAEAENETMTWILRLVGFVLMAIGIFMIFNPFIVLADFLPFLGSFASVVIGFVALLGAVMLSAVTIAVAWLFYRPLIAIPVLIVAGLGFVGVIAMLVRAGKGKPKAPPQGPGKKKSA